jgi:hypothetical protein
MRTTLRELDLAARRARHAQEVLRDLDLATKIDIGLQSDNHWLIGLEALTDERLVAGIKEYYRAKAIQDLAAATERLKASGIDVDPLPPEEELAEAAQ